MSLGYTILQRLVWDVKQFPIFELFEFFDLFDASVMFKEFTGTPVHLRQFKKNVFKKKTYSDSG